ncbi:DUF4435 domain-containing protein [Archangium violaceum]|uniref:DUF4435 domain-containing protein n=1 Tax=Archangium violaceum TaxID=83451 RepID=UPI0036D9FDFD
MSRVESLRKQRETTAAVWLQFITSIRSDVRQLYVFFEAGEDRSFYMPEIRRRAEGWRLHPLTCANKIGVLEMLERARPRLNSSTLGLFFVDRDLDELMGIEVPVDERLFVTAHYSIENYVTTPEGLEIMLSEVMQLSMSDFDLQRIADAYRNAQAIFFKRMRSVMTWIVGHLMDGARPQLNNLDVESLVCVNRDLSVQRQRKDRVLYLQGACVVSPLQTSTYRAARLRTKRVSDKALVRGKYELSFFLAFLRVVVAMQTGANLRRANSIQLSSSSIVTHLAPRIRCSDELKRFLAKNLQAAS